METNEILTGDKVRIPGSPVAYKVYKIVNDVATIKIKGTPTEIPVTDLVKV